MNGIIRLLAVNQVDILSEICLERPNIDQAARIQNFQGWGIPKLIFGQFS